MKLEVITGCVFSGKTEEFISRVDKLERQGKNVAVLKPRQATKYSRHDIVSHSGLKLRSIAVENTEEIWEYIEDCDALAIDEAQFFDWEFAEAVNEIAIRGTHVLISGVDLDFRGKPFGVMPELMALADEVVKKTGVCAVCGEAATRSQRLVNGAPASYSDPVVLEETDESIEYEARCRTHHEVKNKPSVG